MGLPIIKKSARSTANIEAEKGETMLTNVGMDNMFDHVAIGGKKHSEGGTPLEAALNSFIFSDNKKMAIKDPELLKFFGENGKKPLTPADIAKKYDLNGYKDAFKNGENDKITKETNQRNFDNALTKLSALAIVQESLKGTPQGFSESFKPFLDKTGIDPSMLVNAPQVQPQVGQPTMAFGGDLPKAADGKIIKADDLTPEQQKELKEVFNNNKEEYLKYINTEASLKSNSKFAEDLYKHYTDVINDPSNYTKGKKDNWYGALKDRAPQDVINELLAQEKRNAILAAHNIDVANTSNANIKDAGTNKETLDFINKHPELKPVLDFKHGYIGQAAYKAYDKMMSGENYKDLRNYKIKQTGKDDETGSNRQISGIDNANTNTTLGQRLNYIYDKTPNKVEPLPAKKEEPLVTKAQHIDNVDQPNDNMDYFWEDKRALANNVRQLAGIKKYDAFTPIANTSYVKNAYYSPDQLINAINSQLATGVQGQTAFATPQSQTANFTQMQGSAFDQAANAIGNYADRNVAAYNQEMGMNTQIANQKATQDQATAVNDHNQRVILNQNYDNALNAARTAIANQQIAMHQNRANAQNIQEASGEQYKIDPNTGFVYFDKGKELVPTKGSSKTLAEDFAEFANPLRAQGYNDDTLAKLYLHNKYGNKPSMDFTNRDIGN